MHRIKSIEKKGDIPEEIRETPAGDLLGYHNLKMPHKTYQKAELLIGMCMDNRKALSLPENFAYVLRTGGANLRYSEFKVSYAIAVGGVSHIVLIGHTQCGMVNVASRKDNFIQGLCERGGWSADKAEEHFLQCIPMFEIGDAVDFVVSETERLSLRYPKVQVTPLLYKVEDNLLYCIDSES